MLPHDTLETAGYRPMGAGDSHSGGDAPGAVDPRAIYTQRLDALHSTQSVEQQREKRLGYAKLILAAITVIAAVLLLHYLKALEALLAPAALFVILAVLQERLIRRIKLRARAIEFYARGMARLDDRWAGTGQSGERFLDPLHPYARDLDLFGHGSLFELLCTARTRAGEETLAAWLLVAAPVEEAQVRQQAVADLKHRVAFREQLFVLGETVRLGVHPQALSVWGERGPLFASRSTRIVTRTLAMLWIASLAAWVVLGWSPVFAAVTLLNFGWSHHLHARASEAAASLEECADGLTLLAGVLALMERENFAAPKLIALQSALKREGSAASAAIKRLARLAEYVKSRHSFFLRPLDWVTFWSTQLLFLTEQWQRRFGPSIRGWLHAVGELEALTAFAGYACEHPGHVFAEFSESGVVFDAEGLAHPLLPASKAIRNDVKLGEGLQLIILSGPNMAGKSTFIRSVGINAVLAQCGAPVCATRLRLSPLNVAASICILDSLSGGVSRFYAEIGRVKLIADLSAGAIPVLFLLDELLSGTNSGDRLAGSEFVVRTLMERNAIGIVSTHDLALTEMAREVEGRAANFHFEDRYADGELHFDYQLKPGLVQTSNALRLMRAIGLGVGLGVGLGIDASQQSRPSLPTSRTAAAADNTGRRE
jgi:hypothetical protein